MKDDYKRVNIDGQEISQRVKPYIVAELSANHNGSIDNAIELITRAKQCGADAIKLQTYTPDTLTVNSELEDFKIKEGLWAGRTLYELYDWAHTPWDWHEKLFLHAKAIGLTIFSSPFDETAVDLLEALDAPAYKIASFEAVDLELIKYAASKKKPLIISTGMASFVEIGEALGAARSSGAQDVILLHCVSSYPAPAEEYNLRTVMDMAEQFDVLVGLSDHTLDNSTAVTSVAMGGVFIEKHFTLDRSGGGPDDSFSLEPDDLKQLVSQTKTAWQALGNVSYNRQVSEKENLKFRRSLYFMRDMKQGEIVTNDCLRSIRPGYGLAPKYLPNLIGKPVIRDVAKHTAVQKDDFSNL